MNPYVPETPETLYAAGALLAVILALGYALNRLATSGHAWRAIAWTLPLAGGIIAERLTVESPPGFRMLAIVGALLYGLKAVVAVESRLDGKAPLRAIPWLVFCCGWFGMRPELFQNLFSPPLPRTGAFLRAGLWDVCVGTALLAAAWTIAPPLAELEVDDPRTLLTLALLMLGLSFTVHFGLFDLLTGLWRGLGADCPKLFRAPIKSRSLEEFWGRRWNIAFSEMAAISVFRPTKALLGTTGARTLAFLFSGLLHELAISVPVRAGYGLPFAYFVLHALAMRLEALPHIRRRLRHSRVFAHVWTAAWVVFPVPLLFHWPFCREILLPLLYLGRP